MGVFRYIYLCVDRIPSLCITGGRSNKMKWWKKCSVLGLAAVLTLSPMLELSATSLSEAEREKEELEAQLSEAQALIDQLKDSRDDIETKVEELDAQLTTISQQISETEEKLEQKSAEITDTEELLAEAQADVDSQMEDMTKRIQYMYENSSTVSYLDAFFRSGSMGEFLSQAEYIRQITEYDRQMLLQYEESVQYVADMKETLEQELAELEELKAQVEAQQTTVQALVSAKEQELASLDGSISDTQDDVDMYQARIDAQNELIAQIQAEEARRQQEEQNNGGSEDTSQPGDAYSGGAFVWPCPSSTRVTSDYGERIAPTAGASSNHKGIDIGAAYGADIVAAADGTVTFAGYSRGNGNYVMISHGGGLYTVYCHASSLTVSKGQTVKAGDVVAKVGSTGISTANHLHFGVALNGSYVSPWNYLSR